MSTVEFVYLGSRLPKYANASLNLAVQFSGLEVCLIGNLSQRKSITNPLVKFISIEDFYDPYEFESLRHKFNKPSEFRSGFWLNALERFFVLHQYMFKYNRQCSFHAELDQVLVGIDELLKRLERINKKGVFVPFHDATRAVASVFYCNEERSLRNFIDFVKSVGEINNEMELLADWAKISPDKLFALPTLSQSLNGIGTFLEAGITTISEKEIGGVVDAAQLGQWIGGQDPRNIAMKDRPATKFFDFASGELLTYRQLSEIKFSIGNNGGLQCSLENVNSINVFNFHLHSKIHPWLSMATSPMSRFLDLANSEAPVSIRYARIQQVRYRLTYFMKETTLTLKAHPIKFLSIPGKLLIWVRTVFMR